ncbi:hypothetical protein P3L10_009722 [Capsicum annuum]
MFILAYKRLRYLYRSHLITYGLISPLCLQVVVIPPYLNCISSCGKLQLKPSRPFSFLSFKVFPLFGCRKKGNLVVE